MLNRSAACSVSSPVTSVVLPALATATSVSPVTPLTVRPSNATSPRIVLNGSEIVETAARNAAPRACGDLLASACNVSIAWRNLSSSFSLGPALLPVNAIRSIVPPTGPCGRKYSIPLTSNSTGPLQPPFGSAASFEDIEIGPRLTHVPVLG